MESTPAFDFDTDVDTAITASVAAEMRASWIPEPETPEARDARLLDQTMRQLMIEQRDERDRQRHAAARQAERVRIQAEQERLEREAKAAASRALMEKSRQQQAARDALFAQERLAYLESQETARQTQARLAMHERAQAERDKFCDDMIAALQQMNPLRPPTAEERIAALEEELAFQRNY